MSSLVAAMEKSHITAPRSAHSKESSDSIFPFTKLPPEIRNKIYRYVLSTEHTKYNRVIPTLICKFSNPSILILTIVARSQ